MAKQEVFIKEITFRKALPSDEKYAGRLLFETFPKKATYIIGLGDKTRAIRILSDLFRIQGHRLSYDITTIVKFDDRVVGMIIAFPGSEIGKLNWRLDRLLLKQYQIRGKLALILRGFPLFFLKETAPDEFFVSNLVVKHQFRNQGIGDQILKYVEGLARKEGYRKIGLMVALGNLGAKRFYDRLGYKVVAINLESNRRVPYLGPGYQRRVKDI